MASVDNKVVSLKFDNAQFKQRLSETMSGLEKLKAGLNFSGAAKGMQEVSATAGKFNLHELGSSVDGISAKFVALSAVAVTALANITNRAVDSAIQITKAMSIDPVAQGFGEFELKMGSIQTIMAGSGASLDEVNKKLNELNAYSDRTIYSFSDMTSNIGKFTNAGVGLDESVGAIQGVANVAALAGANSGEASRAMYNFAQALSTGSVKLIDWKSIELANMGTVEFKQQIMDTAVAMGTLNKAADGTYTTLEGTEVTTKNFNSTLQEAWFTSDVLTGTLNKFSDETTDIGKRAAKAATEIKTFSQMIGTMKEGVGSGWAMTFEHIFGNFNEGLSLWTGINDMFQGIVGKSADARNQMLSDWKAFGGRDVLVSGLKDAFIGIMSVLKPIKDAFREIFPKKTAQDLINLTVSFKKFTENLDLSRDASEKIKTAFKGFFAIFGIGWEIIKGVVRVFFSLASGIFRVIAPIAKLFAGTGNLTSGLHSLLVEGGGIEKFFDVFTGVLTKAFDVLAAGVEAVVNFISSLQLFDKISNVAVGIADFVAELKIFERVGNGLSGIGQIFSSVARSVGDFFASLNFGKGASKSVEETGKGIEKTAGLFDRLFSTLKTVLSQIGSAFGDIFGGIADAFKGLGDAIAGALGTGNFDNVFNVIKTGLLGGILVMLRKFFKEGISLDFGQGALIDKMKDILDTLQSSLKSLQANVRADTLMKIAGAMGILAISIIALSMIDSDALTKSMIAIGAGFAQLTTVMLALEKLSGTGIGVAKMAAGMIALSIAMALLVIPIKMLSGMNPKELATGLVGVAGGLLVMAVAMKIIGSSQSLTGVVRAGLSMILIAGAMIVMASAIKKFAALDLSTIGLGLGQMAAGLGVLILALNKMPDDVAKKGVGLLILVFSLRSLAKVVALFASIDWQILAKGFGFIAAGLYGMGYAMDQFPDDMVAKSLGVVALSGALFIMGLAIQKVGEMPLGELAKGVGALVIMLIALSAAVVVIGAAKGSIAGLLAAAAGLYVLGKAIQEVGAMPFGDVIKGVGAMAALLIVLAAASFIAPGMLILGAALLTIGAGFALIGAGAALAGMGFKLMAEFGGQGLGILTQSLQAFIKEIPGFLSAFVVGLIEAGGEILKALPQLIVIISGLITALLAAVDSNRKNIENTLVGLIDSAVEVLKNAAVGFVEVGLAFIMGLLKGIEDNIETIVHTVADITTKFLNAFQAEAPRMAKELAETITTVFESLGYMLGYLAPTLLFNVGIAMMQGLWDGMMDLFKNAGELIGSIVDGIINLFKSLFGIQSPSTVMKEIGGFILEGLVAGLKAALGLVRFFFIELPGKVIGWLGNIGGWLLSKGVALITGLLNGIINTAPQVMSWFVSLPGKVLGWIGDVLGKLVPKGVGFLTGLITGLANKVGDVMSWFTGLPGKVVGWIGDVAGKLVQKGRDFLGGLSNGISEKWEELKDYVSGLPGKLVTAAGFTLKTLWDAGKNIVEGLKRGIKEKWDDITSWLSDKASGLKDLLTKPWEVFSPSRFAYRVGEYIVEGLANGLNESWHSAEEAVHNLSVGTKAAFNNAITDITSSFGDMTDINPTITPVLDLTRVASAARGINDLVGVSALSPDVSFNRARYLSTTGPTNETVDNNQPQGPTEIKFEQNNYSPTALSVSDIYRNTKSQIALAKEELKIS